MRQAAPRFSIVMPTRNRAHLLREALQSALEQRYDDFEVVVSDNASDDDTPRIVRELANDRVRAVRTDRVLPMPDSWEFALGHARGEYATVLCDDDALVPQFLSEVERALAAQPSFLVSWTHATYFSRSHPVARWRNQLAIPSHGGSIVMMDSRASLRALFGLRGDPGKLPRMLNSCCHRDVVAGIRARLGRFFLAPNPDTAACAVSLTAVDQYLYLDKPLLIGGAGGESIGASTTHSRSAATLNFLAEFGLERVFAHVPLGVVTVTNSIVETLLRTRRAMPERFEGLEIDWLRYFEDCYVELAALAAAVDVAAERRELRRVLGERPVGFRARVYWRAVRRAAARVALRASGAAIRSVAGLDRALGAAARRRGGARLIRGDEAGFWSILECRKLLEP